MLTNNKQQICNYKHLKRKNKCPVNIKIKKFFNSNFYKNL